MGNWSLVKSCVSLKTATGAACGTSENTDIAAVYFTVVCSVAGLSQTVAGAADGMREDFHLQLAIGDCEVGVSGSTNRNLDGTAKPIPGQVKVQENMHKGIVDQ